MQVLFILPEKLYSNYFFSFLRNNIDPSRLRLACIDEDKKTKLCRLLCSPRFRPEVTSSLLVFATMWREMEEGN